MEDLEVQVEPRKRKIKHAGVLGVGTNDADYKINRYVEENGVRKLVWNCPYYTRWRSMLNRCYSEKSLKEYPTYRGCTVCEEWLTFSNFKKWMEKQDWEGKDLDKDLLVDGNKIYSPDTCVFIEKIINTFSLECVSQRGMYKIGVCYIESRKSFIARCNNPISKRLEFLGYYKNEQQAHEAWVRRKSELVRELRAEGLIPDDRVYRKLLYKYGNYS